MDTHPYITEPPEEPIESKRALSDLKEWAGKKRAECVLKHVKSGMTVIYGGAEYLVARVENGMVVIYDEPPTLHVDYINPRNITIPLANEKDDSFPLCPRCKTSSQMRLNPSNLRFSCDGCGTTWSRQYLKGWNDGYPEVMRDNPMRLSLEISDVRWEYEDCLPEMEDSDFDTIFPASRVLGIECGGVRMYPYVEDSAGNRVWISNLPNAGGEGPPRSGPNSP